MSKIYFYGIKELAGCGLNCMGNWNRPQRLDVSSPRDENVKKLGDRDDGLLKVQTIDD